MKVTINNIKFPNLQKQLEALHTLKIVDTTVAVEVFKLFDSSDFKKPLQHLNCLESFIKMVESSIQEQYEISVSIKEEDKFAYFRAKIRNERQNEEFHMRILTSDLAQVEEILLESGFIFISREHIRKISYLYTFLQTKYDFYLTKKNNYVRVTSPNGIKLAQAIALIGYDMSQVEF